jgi:hypothetical protein
MAMTDEEKKASVEKAESDGKDKEKKDMEYEEKEGEEEEKSCAKKSDDLTEDDLEKSLSKLEEYVEKGDVPTRKQVLLEKAQKEELTKSEQAEIFQILGGGEVAPSETLVDEVSKAMEPTEDLQKALDVSDFLSETHEEAKNINKLLADRIEKSGNRQNEFNLILAKSVALIGKLAKSMDTRLADIEMQPVRKPKSQARPLNKSFANTTPASETLSKSDILNTMTDMVEKSCNAGQQGMVNNIDMVKAAAKYEQLNQINPAVLEMVKQARSAAQ